MIEVAIANEQSLLSIDEARITRAISAILTDAETPDASISVALVDDETIHDLNRRFLEHDYATDVLSFVLEKDDTHLDGEIIASTDYASRSAEEYGWAATDELLLYIIHGTLHLIGYDDLDEESRQVMRAQEQHYLGLLGLTAPRK